MVEFPKDWNDPMLLADWMELHAIDSGDKNSSSGDLIDAIFINSNDYDQAEVLSIKTINELVQRSYAAKESYPFAIKNNRVLYAKDDLLAHTAYVFCLCLSYFGWKQQKGAEINPWILFEELSCIAAKEYLKGEVIWFGEHREGEGFIGKVGRLATSLGEGGGFKKQPTLDRKDDGVDLVAWKEFADQKPSKLIIFGQCGAGQYWKDKLGQLNPIAFWDQWMKDSKVSSDLVKSFYMPHRVDTHEFEFSARKAGILFDRCRLSYWAFQDNNKIMGDERYLKWSSSVFEALSAKRNNESNPV